MQKINVLIIDPIQLPSLSEYIQSEISFITLWVGVRPDAQV